MPEHIFYILVTNAKKILFFANYLCAQDVENPESVNTVCHKMLLLCLHNQFSVSFETFFVVMKSRLLLFIIIHAAPDCLRRQYASLFSVW